MIRRLHVNLAPGMYPSDEPLLLSLPIDTSLQSPVDWKYVTDQAHDEWDSLLGYAEMADLGLEHIDGFVWSVV